MKRKDLETNNKLQKDLFDAIDLFCGACKISTIPMQPISVKLLNDLKNYLLEACDNYKISYKDYIEKLNAEEFENVHGENQIVRIFTIRLNEITDLIIEQDMSRWRELLNALFNAKIITREQGEDYYEKYRRYLCGQNNYDEEVQPMLDIIKVLVGIGDTYYNKINSDTFELRREDFITVALEKTRKITEVQKKYLLYINKIYSASEKSAKKDLFYSIFTCTSKKEKDAKISAFFADMAEALGYFDINEYNSALLYDYSLNETLRLLDELNRLLGNHTGTIKSLKTALCNGEYIQFRRLFSRLKNEISEIFSDDEEYAMMESKVIRHKWFALPQYLTYVNKNLSSDKYFEFRASLLEISKKLGLYGFVGQVFGIHDEDDTKDLYTIIPEVLRIFKIHAHILLCACSDEEKKIVNGLLSELDMVLDSKSQSPLDWNSIKSNIERIFEKLAVIYNSHIPKSKSEQEKYMLVEGLFLTSFTRSLDTVPSTMSDMSNYILNLHTQEISNNETDSAPIKEYLKFLYNQEKRPFIAPHPEFFLPQCNIENRNIIKMLQININNLLKKELSGDQVGSLDLECILKAFLLIVNNQDDRDALFKLLVDCMFEAVEKKLKEYSATWPEDYTRMFEEIKSKVDNKAEVLTLQMMS